MQFTPGRLLAFVTVAGVAYAGFTFRSEQETRLAHAGACRANLNLIDRYIAMWERQHVELSAKSGMLSLDLTTVGTIARASGVLSELGPGSDALAKVARDPDAFVCPSEGTRLFPGRTAVHYRWVMSEDPLAALDGGTRGTVCVLHGERRAPDDKASWHALVKGRNP